MAKKEEFYGIAFVVSSAFFICIILVAAPYGGYLIGSFLGDKFGFKNWFIIGSIILGIITAILQITRIIKICRQKLRI